MRKDALYDIPEVEISGVRIVTMTRILESARVQVQVSSNKTSILLSEHISNVNFLVPDHPLSFVVSSNSNQSNVISKVTCTNSLNGCLLSEESESFWIPYSTSSINFNWIIEMLIIPLLIGHKSNRMKIYQHMIVEMTQVHITKSSLDVLPRYP
jgi:hypothetical protein